MINKFLAIALLLFIALGCGVLDRAQESVADKPGSNTVLTNTNSNKSLTDKAVETAMGEKETGIPECDEAIRAFAEQMNNPEDNFVEKAGKKLVENTFREQLKQQLEQNQANKAEIARFCKEFRNNVVDSTNSNSNAN